MQLRFAPLMFVLVSAALHAGEPAPAAATPKPITPEQLEFFEKKIRPVLATTCYECHSAQSGKTKGGLSLDTRDGVLKGGVTGAVIVAGEPEKSPLLKAVRGDDPDAAMPPKGAKLTKEQIADIAEWIKMGAPDPRSGQAALTAIEQLMQKSKEHWAFQPVKEPALPATAAKNPVDAFLLAKLAEKNLAFAPQADKRALIRRATFDLHGLPPTPEEVDAFVADTSPDSYEKLIDRLLASSRYGERWGRHWLDVARYSDTMGAIFGGDDQYAYAYSYRDYVIRAFNEDLPYDRFIMEQLAADHISKEDDTRPLAAMGFLTLGRRKDRNVDDEVYDDRIDVLSRGLLGLTVSCARCHDHKLEPIPTKDYYGLYAVLRSSKEPEVYPTIQPVPETPEHLTYLKERDKLCAAAVTAIANEADGALDEIRGRVGEYLLAMVDGKGKRTKDNNKLVAELLKPRKLNDALYDLFVERHKNWFEKNQPVFGVWLSILSAKDEERDAKTPELIAAYTADAKTNPRIAELLKGREPKTAKDLAEVYAIFFGEVNTACRMTSGGKVAATREMGSTDVAFSLKQLEGAITQRVAATVWETELENTALEAGRKALSFKDAATNPKPESFRDQRLFSEDAKKAIDTAVKPYKELEKHPGAPARAMVLRDDKIYDGKVYLRGNPNTQGAPAPRQYLEALRGSAPPFPKDKSGRHELAQLIASPDNPLTARVFVNRVWAWHFGTGIVRTPSDFGYRGDRPTHPELLDYLAARFVKDGWSVKKLHKTLMLSAAYQQSSVVPPAVVKEDPENRLLARMNARPLEFEAYRDAQLSVAGRLDLKAGGRAVDLLKNDKDALRRTVYGVVDRKTLPNLFRNFDFPDPNFSAAQRSRTALTPQALYLLNSSALVENARALGTKAKPAKDVPIATGIRALYQSILQRQPSEREVSRATAFLESYPQNDIVRPEATDWQYGRGSFDITSKSVKNFVALAQYNGKAWQMPDKALGNLQLNAEGGEPGKGENSDAIRRWIAPLDGKVKINGELQHIKKDGDGIIARVVLNGTTLLGEWTALNKGASTLADNITVKKGETLDFIVSGGKDPNSDTFQWAPTVTMTTAEMPGMPGMPRIWDAKTDFMDIRQMPKPLGPWEELAQVLLLSNEFMWVD